MGGGEGHELIVFILGGALRYRQTTGPSARSCR